MRFASAGFASSFVDGGFEVCEVVLDFDGVLVGA
jgi:hypothetical protein